MKKYLMQILLLILFGYCVLLIILSSIPGDFAVTSNPFDKILHFGAYAILSIPLYFTLSIQDKIIIFNKYPGISTLLLAFLFGFINEIYQLFITSRTFNKFDLLANILGTLMVILLIKFAAMILRANRL